MALQVGLNSSSKVLILVGAGLTGSIVLNSGQLSAIITQLQELLKAGVDEVEISSTGYDPRLIAAQVRQLAQEIKELTLSRPVTIYNENSSSGGLASYFLPAAAIGAMGYGYMWWKGWSFSDVMFVTKQNMANAVATVSKQLENVHETLASTKRHLTKRLEGLDRKLDEQNELGQLISNDVSEVKSDLSQIGCDVELIHKIISGLEGKLELVEGKQDITNSGLWYLCQFTEGLNDGPNGKVLKDNAETTNRTTMTLEEKTPKGLQFIAETTDTVENSPILTKKVGLNSLNEKLSVSKPRIHRSYPGGISVSKGITDLAFD